MSFKSSHRIIIFITLSLSTICLAKPKILSHHNEETEHRHIRPISSEDHLAFPPLAHCHGPIETAASASAQCLERCPNQDKPHKLVGLDVFSARQSETIVNISSCETYRYSQRFTETWLMSRTSSQMIRERIKTNITQCEMIFKNDCGGKACDTTLPSSLDPSYKWASEVEVVSDISLLTRHSALRYYSTNDATVTSGKLWIPDIEEEIVRSEGHYYHEENDRLYLWEQKILSDYDCPVRDFTPSTCLELGDDGFWCDKLKIFLRKGGGDISISQCLGPFKKSGPYLYKPMTLGNIHLTDSKFIYDMVEGNSLNDLVHMINHVLKLRDTEHCIEDCLGIKNIMEPLSLIMAGYTYYQKVNNSHVLPCEPEFKCVLKLPVSACQIPPMVRVECDSGDAWFLLEKGITAKYEHCMKTHSPTTGTIFIPSNLGKIIVNQSGLYLDESVTGGLIAHPDPLSNPHQTGNFIHLKDPIRYKKIKEASESSKSIKVHTSLSLSRLLSIAQYPIVWLREQLATIKDTVKLLILLVMIIMISIIIFRCFPKRDTGKVRNSRTRSSLSQGTVEERSPSLSSQESPTVPRYQVSG